MPRNERFDSDGVAIAYDDLRPDGGGGTPIVLVHGFASNRQDNWATRGWYETLGDRGYRVIALDNRGHGDSEKPHDSAAYPLETMAGDVVRLLDHREIESAALFGYSMGARISMELLQSAPERVEAAVLGGVGGATLGGLQNREHIATALEAPDVDVVDNPVGRRFRLFAEETGADLEALAAVIRAHDVGVEAADLADVPVPVLVAAGADDDIAGDPAELADAFPDGEAATIPDRDHLTTVPDENFEAAVRDFLAHRIGPV